MSLSHNIPLHENLLGYLVTAMPQCPSLYCILQYENGAYSGSSLNGELELDEAIRSYISTAKRGWYAEYETPFSLGKKIGQTRLEQELDRDYLFLPDLDAKEGKLFVILQFRTSSMNTHAYLNASEKRVVESMVRGFVDSFLRLRESDLGILRGIAKSSEKVEAEFRRLYEELNQKNEYYESLLAQLLGLSINRLEKKHKVKISYGKEFLKSLREFRGPMENLEEILDSEVELSSNLAQLRGESEVVLNALVLQTVRNKALAKKQSPALQLGRFTKTYQLLERYELSAEKAHAQGKSIIGKNIGEFCSPPISNAAITDSLNKHSRKIYELFERYPEKWPIIRSEFRSVANILEKETERRRAGNL